MPHSSGDLTPNEELLDALVRHQILLLALSKSLRRKITIILNRTEVDLRDKIARRLATMSGGATPDNLRRSVFLMSLIKSTRLRAWREVEEVWASEMVKLASAETQFMDNALKTVAPAVLETIIPSTALLRAVALSRPFEGRTLSQWAKSVAAVDLERIQAQVMVGMVQGETSRQIARRVVGTTRLRGRDGVTEISRRQAAAIARTAIIAVSSYARREFLNANSDLFSEEQYVATLDGRTTAICRSLDGRRFAIGQGPIPPLHFNCRSLRVAVIDGVAMGKRPARSFTQRQLLREYTAARGIGSVTSRSDLPLGHRGVFDQYARSRMRELTGQVPGGLSYQDWLTRQPASFQDDVLGRTRGRLFRRGDLTLDRFVSREGHEYNLSELAARERQSFIDAGLDPDDFT